jgi:hypothetical protein
MEVRLRLEVRDKGGLEFSEYRQGSWPEAILDDQPATSFGTLRIKAHDLTNAARIGWQRIQPTELGTEVVKPPKDLLVPEAIRIRITWMSTRGGHAEQVLLWRTEDVNLLHPFTWQFESLTIDPGRDEGGAIRFEAPKA